MRPSQVSPGCRPRWSQVAGAAAFAACFLATATPAHAAQAEQISRADGVAGASPIESHASTAVISPDGTSAYTSFTQTWGTWSTASGLWRRDLATNRTQQIVAGEASTAGFSADGKLLGFRTNKRLVGSDRNNADDLYGYDTTTRRYNLISRQDGHNAAATGLTGAAFITRDGKSALLSTSAGIIRRTLATGRSVKVADGALGDYTQLAASADGTVFFTAAGNVVAPGGVQKVTTADTYAPYVTFTPNGRYAVVQATRASDGAPVGSVLDTTTGARTTFDPASLGAGARLVGFTADNRAMVARSTGQNSFEVIAITVPSAAVSRLATYSASLYSLSSITADAKFIAVSANGPSYAISADGTNLPGGADLPSPGVFAVVYPGCRASGWPFNLPAESSVLAPSDPTAIFPLPALEQLSIRVTSASGALLQSYTFNAGADWASSKLPVGGGFKLTATVKYADGRTNSETWTVPAPKDSCSVGF